MNGAPGLGAQGGEDRGLCRDVFGFLGGGLRRLLGLRPVDGGDISAVSCEAFEDGLEDGTAEKDHVLGIREIGRGFLLRSGSEGCGGKVFGR
jgi:hypothetical protein